MTPVYEFSAYLRLHANGEEEARRIAESFAAAISCGQATLALDDSSPTVEYDEEEERR
jgi:hypothetical protein